MLKKLKSPFGVTVALWALVCAVHTGWSLHSYLSPPEPHDVYDKKFGFQFGVWMIFGLPIWLGILALALLLVHFSVLFWRRFYDRNS
jgi:hypothetical protein